MNDLDKIVTILINFMKFYQGILHDYNPDINFWTIADTLNYEKFSKKSPEHVIMTYEIIRSQKILTNLKFDLNIFCLYYMCDIILSHPESDDDIMISEYYISEEDEQLFNDKCEKCPYLNIHKNCQHDENSHYNQLTSSGRFLLTDIIGPEIINSYIYKHFTICV